MSKLKISVKIDLYKTDTDTKVSLVPRMSVLRGFTVFLLVHYFCN